MIPGTIAIEEYYTERVYRDGKKGRRGIGEKERKRGHTYFN